MRRAKRGDFHVSRLQHHAIFGDVFGDQKLAQVGTAFVLDAGFDIEPVQFEKRFRHRLDALRAERMDRRRKSRGPGIIDEIAVFEIVIGMVMADENVSHRFQRHARGDKLATDAHPAIDHERRVVHDHEICGIRAPESDTRPTFRSQEDDAGARLCGLRKRRRRSQRRGGGKPQFQYIAAIDHHILPSDFRLLQA